MRDDAEPKGVALAAAASFAKPTGGAATVRYRLRGQGRAAVPRPLSFIFVVRFAELLS